jgi:hypothetical protein
MEEAGGAVWAVSALLEERFCQVRVLPHCGWLSTTANLQGRKSNPTEEKETWEKESQVLYG